MIDFSSLDSTDLSREGFVSNSIASFTAISKDYKSAVIGFGACTLPENSTIAEVIRIWDFLLFSCLVHLVSLIWFSSLLLLADIECLI